jgi:hypothetical protein
MYLGGTLPQGRGSDFNRYLETAFGQALMAHFYNPSYLGGRDQEDQGLKPAQANSLWDPSLKIPNTKRAGGVAPGVGPEFKPQYHKKKKKKKKPARANSSWDPILKTPNTK